MGKYAVWPDGDYCELHEVEKYSDASDDDYQIVDEAEFVEVLIAPRMQSIRVRLDIGIDQLNGTYDELEQYTEIDENLRNKLMKAKRYMKVALEILYEV